MVRQTGKGETVAGCNGVLEKWGGGTEEKGGMVGLLHFGSCFCTVTLHSLEQ